MPYTFSVEVKESSIQGQGLFAAEDIPEGAVYWVYHCEDPLPIEGLTIGENRVYKMEQLEAEPEERLERLLHDGCYLPDYDLFMVFEDGSEYMNHPLSPNSQIIYPASRDYRDLVSIALRPIKKGEEIVESYANYLSTKSEWVVALM